MNRLFLTLNREKVKEHLAWVATSLKLSLLLLDEQSGVLLHTAGDCQVPACLTAPSCPHGFHLEQIPFPASGESSIFLATCSHKGEQNSERLVTASSFLERMLHLEYEIADLSAEVVRLYEEQSFLYNLTSRLGTDMDLDSLCTRVLDEVSDLLQVRNCSIMLAEKGGDKVTTRLSMGMEREAASHFSFLVDSGRMGDIFRKGEPVTICDISLHGTFSLPYPVHSLLCVPLVTDGKSIGMLVASDKLNKEEFWSQELKIMRQLASDAAAAIRKAQLYEKISTLFMNTVTALASAIDAKDPYTYGHSRRVAKISTQICNRMGMPRKKVREVELAAMLHDIGKIGTPEQILQKPGRLEPLEMEQIRRHPEQGAQILSNIPELQHVVSWIRHHHEWYNGNGYPGRIKAKQIPLQARIITVADTFDAMTSDRPYRKGMPFEEAIRIMDEFSGSQLDPYVMEIFRELLYSSQLDFCKPGQREEAKEPFANNLWTSSL